MAATMNEKRHAVLAWLMNSKYSTLKWEGDRFGNYVAVDTFGKKLRLKPKELVIRFERKPGDTWFLIRSYPITATFKEQCKVKKVITA
jgi:hypothetical protein